MMWMLAKTQANFTATSSDLWRPMEWGTLIFSAFLVALSLVLLAVHWNAWRKSDHGGLGERPRNSSAANSAGARKPAA